MQVVFFNIKTQDQYPYEVDDAIGENMEDMRMLVGGEVYRLISTVPDEVRKLNKYRSEFEDKEFKRLYETKFCYKTKEEVPENFFDLFKQEIESEEVYKRNEEFFKSIGDNLDKVVRTLCTHYLTFMFMTNRVNDIVASNKKDMLAPSYALDFAKRFRNFFAVSSWYNTKSIREFSEGLDQLKRYMDIDERRNAGYNKLLQGVGLISKDISDVLMGANITELNAVKISAQHEKYGKVFEQIKEKFAKSYEYYDNFIKEIENTVKKIQSIDPDKHIAYLKVAKPIVTKFLTDTDKYMKDASKIENNDKAQLEQVKKTYISNLLDYFDSLHSIFMSYDADTTEVPAERAKQFNAVWDSSFYYKDNCKQGDWFIQLAKLLYNSYNDLFGEILTEEEKVKKSEETH